MGNVPSPVLHRCAGWLLTCGFVVFMVGAVFWRMEFQNPDLGEALRSVARNLLVWQWIHGWLALGVVTTMIGLTAWTEAQRSAGENLATPIGFTLYGIGAILWLVAIAMRLTIATSAAREVTSAGAVPAAYPSAHLLAGALYAAHMVLAWVSFVPLGIGVLRSGIVTSKVGWAGVACGLAGTTGFVLARGGLLGAPFFAHVYTAAIGIAVLLRGR
jgi:hypothetical protein